MIMRYECKRGMVWGRNPWKGEWERKHTDKGRGWKYMTRIYSKTAQWNPPNTV
jgi:hypothetical protein